MATKSKTTEKTETKQIATLGGYYVGSDDPTEIYFRTGVRKSKKDELAARAADEDNALVLVEQLNVYYACTCGAADELDDSVLGEDE